MTNNALLHNLDILDPNLTAERVSDTAIRFRMSNWKSKLVSEAHPEAVLRFAFDLIKIATGMDPK